MVVLRHADQQRAAGARAHHTVGLARGNRRDRVGAPEFRDRLLHRLEQVAAVIGMDQVRDDFGIGLRDEAIAPLFEPLAQRLEILDDSVMDDRDLVMADVRMRVGRRGRAMRCPARVRDTGRAHSARRVRLRREIGDASRADQPLQAAVDHGEARRVVAAILEPADAVDQGRYDVFARDGADDAAHL